MLRFAFQPVNPWNGHHFDPIFITRGGIGLPLESKHGGTVADFGPIIVVVCCLLWYTNECLNLMIWHMLDR